MSYTLIGSPRSPFARAVRLFLMKNGIDYHFRALDFLNNQADAAALAKESPINKVPILVDGDQRIFDSRVIVNELIHRHGLRRLSVEQENLVSAIYGVLDVTVNTYLLERDGIDLAKSPWYMPRQRERIARNLDYLTPWARDLNPARTGDWDYPAMCLFSYLDWAKERGLLDIENFPVLAAFRERFLDALGVVLTDAQKTPGALK